MLNSPRQFLLQSRLPGPLAAELEAIVDSSLFAGARGGSPLPSPGALGAPAWGSTSGSSAASFAQALIRGAACLA